MVDRSVGGQLLAVHGVSGRVERCERLDAGYWEGVKYVLWVDGAPVYPLRLTAADVLPRRRAEFEALAVHYERGVLCSRPLALDGAPG